ncbi:hypothetical protein AM1_1467 [Acaryochloris marina MBIC11017]|uniref:Uncharacterized protein n=1 Tax=Acaryochloris marina (strain MBIC 11017) TaxID=329726 RepID=B0C7V4_ACAM1|nr:hypothetical protein AM1_1467 [Acaryochloris marina MBIC11017]
MTYRQFTGLCCDLKQGLILLGFPPEAQTTLIAIALLSSFFMAP